MTNKWKFNEPIVFQSKSGEWWKSNGYDLTIYHPRSVYRNGRPTWLAMNGMRRETKINLKKLKLKANKNLFGGSEPILIQAFYANESADAVPVDQIILYRNKEIPVLMLSVGSFRILAMDKSGKIIGGYKV